MWGVIHFIGFCSLIFLITESYQSFALNPLITTLYDTVYPIRNIPFPAVTFCSNNRISKREAKNFAAELWVFIFIQSSVKLKINFQERKRHTWTQRAVLSPGNDLLGPHLPLRNWKRTLGDCFPTVFGSDKRQSADFSQRILKLQLWEHHRKGLPA